jgi:murein L,D-transpeptidase YcbB/YkuD
MYLKKSLQVAVLLLMPLLAHAQSAVDARIQYLSEQLLVGAEVQVGGATLASAHIIPELYSRRQFTPAWTDSAQVDEFLKLVGHAYEEGLDPDDYLHAELAALVSKQRQNPDDFDLAADVDVLLTESLARYGHHLIYGKVDPADLDDNWNWARGEDGQDPVALVKDAIESGSIATTIAEFLDRGPIYLRVKAMLAEYRGHVEAGGWPHIDDGPTLKPGTSDERVAVIRTRLAITGDLPTAEDNGSKQFDDALENGVQRFQERHNLDADGVVGKNTVAAMNVTAEERVDQLRVNLERLRWIIRDLEDDFVVTNIAAFQTVFVRNGEIVWSARSQVGRDYRQTPVFRDEITYLQFNPTWTVPPGILTNDILPAVKNDIGYLASKNMDLIDRDGSKVDPATVDWSQYRAGRLPPYQFVQRPGPTNALGRVKFIFPNPHFVFLHDTPSKSLFNRTERAFSSGCIRVENPFEFAELLLDNARWNQDSIQALLDSEKPQTVFLNEPMTVMLLYATISVVDNERVRFFADIYNRDGRVLESLDSQFEFRLPGNAG